MITTTHVSLPLELPLEVLLQLPLGAEYEILHTELDRRQGCLCLVLSCVSGAVRLFWKSAIRACL